MPIFRSRGEEIKDTEYWVSEGGEPSKGRWGWGGVNMGREFTEGSPQDLVRGGWRALLLPYRDLSHESLLINARQDVL